MVFKRALTQAISCMLALLLALFAAMPLALSEQIIYENPSIPSGTPAYDPAKPESLIQDQLYAHSAILIEAESGAVIFEKDADRHMYPASTTKILTALLALQAGELSDMVTVSERAVDIPGDATSAKLKPGEEINLEELLYATMLVSANDGANAIAEHISGSIEAFADYMNRAAYAFGCTNTHFTNPSGLYDPNHYTTARDMALIAREAMNNVRFQSLCSVTSYTLSETNLQKRRNLSGKTDFLMNTEGNQYYYPYGTGIKTGYLDAAGNCFVGSATKDGVSLISVVFYSRDKGRYQDTIRLMEYGFSQYASFSPIELYEMSPLRIDTTNFSLQDSDIGRLTLYARPLGDASHASIVVNKSDQDTLMRDFRQMIIVNYTRDFAAPVAYGDVFGTMTYVPPSGDVVEYELYASRDINVRENAPKSIAQIEAEAYADPNPFPPLSLELVLTLLWPFAALFFVIFTLIKLLKRRRMKLAKLPPAMRRRYK